MLPKGVTVVSFNIHLLLGSLFVLVFPAMGFLQLGASRLRNEEILPSESTFRETLP